jgi:hypothetical protein
MAMDTGFQQQQPLAFTAAVRSTPSPQHAAHLDIKGEATKASSTALIAPEQKSFDPRPER